MKIAICEDELADEQFLRQTLELLLNEQNLSYSMISFTSGKQMLAALETESFDISFIDIYLDEVDGVALAKEMRKNNRNSAIIFTTSSQEYMAEGYTLGVLHYLVKPFSIADVKEALDRALLKVKEYERCLEVVVHRRKELIFFRDIKYVESQSRCCVLHTTSGEKAVYENLNRIEKQLEDPSFLRCHRSFIVNMDNVMALETQDFVLFSGEKVPMKRDNVKALREAYVQYRLNAVRKEV
ncbi:LytR/AlgR family response regulator transcription factor [Candidatus Enterococcus ferrettii]|uniref:Stage 0 sporulation protein A homolog n=1 Tax=Candidatus Enterococcus ferrettii TaxID=2815324 RepID=A0ABV0EQB8_9ENTE|nr:LytTR family DNA-binding domain-containing protein [Enterococcus sp. 665A]MBO1342895.1 response regulator transcription factor [Enterococcus sp. 665A]